MAIEQEIKLSCPGSATLEAVLHDPLVRALALEPTPRDHSFVATYYDTRDRALLAARLAFRSRVAGGVRRIGLKGNGGVVAGVSRREEWEQECPAAPLERFGDLPPGEIRERVLALLAPQEPLVALMVTDVGRRVLELELEPGCRVELALDQGTVRAGGREAPVVELELEGLCGPFAPVERLAAALMRHHPLTHATHSKFTLGLSLL